MKKEEKEARLAEHVAYYDLIDKLRDMYIDALDDLSVDSIISALDRIKVEMIQQQVIVEIEDSQKQKQNKIEQSEIDNDSEEESEVEGDVVLPPHTDIKAGSPFVNLSELEEGMRKGMLNN